jgi:hypothetical protein
MNTLWRACNLTSFSPCLTGLVDYPFASHHKGPRFKSLGGNLCETRILLLALSRYIGDPDVIDHFCGLVWGGLRPESSLDPHADDVISHLISQSSSVPVSCLLQVPLLASQLTESAAGGEPCAEPTISNPGSNHQDSTYVKQRFSCQRCLATTWWFIDYFLPNQWHKERTVIWLDRRSEMTYG